MKPQYEELKQQINDAIQNKVNIKNGICTLELCNDTPSAWQVTIVEAGVVFAYADGGTYKDGPYQINLKTGDCFEFRSNDPTACVNEVFLATLVRVQNEERPFNHLETAGNGECFLHIPLKLGQRATATLAELANDGVLLELTSA